MSLSLSKRDERGLRQLIKLAKEEGAKGVSYHGATIWLPRQAAAKQSSRACSEGSDQECTARPRQGVSPPAQAQGYGEGAQRTVAAGTSRQRRDANRLQKHKVLSARYKVAGEKLRAAMTRCLRFVRWQKMQAIWTDWMREQAAALAQKPAQTIVP